MVRCLGLRGYGFRGFGLAVSLGDPANVGAYVIELFSERRYCILPGAEKYAN